MNKFNTNYFLNFLNEHIKKVKQYATMVANAKIVNIKVIEKIFRMTEIQALSLIKELSNHNIIDWNIISNNIFIDIKNRDGFINYICKNRKYETQIMYLKLCGKITPEKLSEVFNLSILDAQILYSKLLANSGYLKTNSNDALSINNIINRNISLARVSA